jgi:hypothetical protein
VKVGLSLKGGRGLADEIWAKRPHH